MVAVVTIGFVKDAVHHIDVSGFNVYNKHRLIKVMFAMVQKECALNYMIFSLLMLSYKSKVTHNCWFHILMVILFFF